MVKCESICSSSAEAVPRSDTAHAEAPASGSLCITSIFRSTRTHLPFSKALGNYQRNRSRSASSLPALTSNLTTQKMFGNRNPRPPVGRQIPPQQPAPNSQYNRLPPENQGGYGAPSSYGRPQQGGQRPSYGGAPSEKPEYSRGGAPRQAPSGQIWSLRPAKSPDNRFIFGNL